MWLVLIVLLLADPLYAQGAARPLPHKPSVAVLDLAPTGVLRREARELSDRLAGELHATGAFRIMPRSQMDATLAERNFRWSGECDEKCAVEIGKLVGVERVVLGSVSLAGGTYALTVKMVDVKSGRVVGGADEACACPIEEVLSTVTQRVAKLLVGGPGVEKPGARQPSLEPAKKGGKAWLWALVGVAVAGGAAAAALGGGGGGGGPSPGTVSVAVPDPFGGP